MPFLARRKSSTSSSSDNYNSNMNNSSTSLDSKTLSMTLPIAPREDDYNMSEETRQQRLLTKCSRKSREPWKSARPLPSSKHSSHSTTSSVRD